MAAEKSKLNVNVDPHIEKRFRELSDGFGGRLGMCLSAAMMQFIETDPKVQADWLMRCFQAELHDQMNLLVEQAKAEQVKRIKSREGREK